MTAALAVLAAAAVGALPQLPQRGLVLETKAGVQLQTMTGNRLASLPGLDLAPDKTVAHGVVMRAGDGRLVTLDLRARRVRLYHESMSTVPTCRMTDARLHEELYVCGSVIRKVFYGPPGSRPSLRVVAHAPGKVGHWVWAEFAPRGPGFLAQWSAECEAPVAYFVSGGTLRAYGDESAGLGWLPTGEAVIHFPNGPCASGWRPVRGIYAVPRKGNPRLILRTPRLAQYAMWGG